jgi:tetratricopeptide (TPR) repeat protein
VETVRAQAMRDHAYVLAFMGRFEEALKYAERSGQTFAMIDAMSFDLARLALVKAFIVRMMNRSAEALQLTREAAAIFLRIGERARHANARMTEGAILYDAGAFEEALGVFRSLEGNPHLDAISEVRITHNIATCLCDLGRQTEAVAPLERCMAEYSRLGMFTERARARWYLGNARLGAGCPSEGIFLLRAAWRELAELEMTTDAALAALDLADALIATGNAAEALPICRQVIVELTDAGLPEQATRALMTLHEAVAMGALSREVIRSTHAEVRNARRRVGLQRLHGLA